MIASSGSVIVVVILLGVSQLELTDAIAKSLIRTVDSVQRDWPSVVQVQAGTADAMRRLAECPDISTTEFCRLLFSSRHKFAETLFLCALPETLRASIADTLECRKKFQASKEKYVKMGEYEKAANCRDSQQKLTSQIADRLEGKTLMITSECVTTSIAQLGWLENNT